MTKAATHLLVAALLTLSLFLVTLAGVGYLHVLTWSLGHSLVALGTANWLVLVAIVVVLLR